jgi:hypothetical protein
MDIVDPELFHCCYQIGFVQFGCLSAGCAHKVWFGLLTSPKLSETNRGATTFYYFFALYFVLAFPLFLDKIVYVGVCRCFISYLLRINKEHTPIRLFLAQLGGKVNPIDSLFIIAFIINPKYTLVFIYLLLFHSHILTNYSFVLE